MFEINSNVDTIFEQDLTYWQECWFIHSFRKFKRAQIEVLHAVSCSKWSREKIWRFFAMHLIYDCGIKELADILIYRIFFLNKHLKVWVLASKLQIFSSWSGKTFWRSPNYSFSLNLRNKEFEEIYPEKCNAT